MIKEKALELLSRWCHWGDGHACYYSKPMYLGGENEEARYGPYLCDEHWTSAYYIQMYMTTEDSWSRAWAEKKLQNEKTP